MTYTIERTHKKGLLSCRFRLQPRWSVLANYERLFGFDTGKLRLLEDGTEKYAAAQHWSLRHFAGKLPVLNLFVASPYIITSGGREIGAMRRPQGEYGLVAVINDIPYEYRLHSHYIWSFTRGNRQIGLIKFETKKHQYTVQVNAEGEDNLDILLLLCGCFDRGNRMLQYTIGTNYIPRDKYRERALWQP